MLYMMDVSGMYIPSSDDSTSVFRFRYDID